MPARWRAAPSIKLGEAFPREPLDAGNVPPLDTRRRSERHGLQHGGSIRKPAGPGGEPPASATASTRASTP
jgi:hypothetical protein